MFGLFKRSKIAIWEIELLKNVLIKLPTKYSILINQINDGLLKGVLIDVSDIPGYIAFTYNSEILKKYERNNERDYKLTNIKIYDNRSLGYVPYEVYVLGGTICGYTLNKGKKSYIDLTKVDVSDFKKEFMGNSDYSQIVHLLNQEEIELINPSNVYSIFIFGKEYFHLEDLEDGDFIGIDKNKTIFKIAHDPMEAIMINKTLSEVLKRN